MRAFILLLLLMASFSLSAEAAGKKKTNKAKPVVDGKQAPEPEESELWNWQLCPNGVEHIYILGQLNPYDSLGRCFEYVGGQVQLLNRSKALYGLFSSRTPAALINFGDTSAPAWYAGPVLGKGAYNYQTVMGAGNTILSFVPVPKGKSRERWEIRKNEEKKAELEAKEKQRKGLFEHATYTDEKNDIMWTTLGNVRQDYEYGGRMHWKDAVDWVKSIDYAGYKDWRLPTREEMATFVMHAGQNPAVWLEENGFKIVEAGDYWTSTVYGTTPYSQKQYYVFSFKDGKEKYKTEDDNIFVWPVRDIKKK